MRKNCGNCIFLQRTSGYMCSFGGFPVQCTDTCVSWRKNPPSKPRPLMRKQIEQIADAYEFTHQSMKLFEEIGELQQAIAKLALDDGPESEYDANLPNVKEELADVQIMLLQIIYLLDISDGELKQIMESKLDRQIRRMEGDDNQSKD